MAHLTSFIVENFKRFEHFEMHNIGQFNLIVGGNNVGKTNVLEALLILKSAPVYAWRLKKVLNDVWHFTEPANSFFTYFVHQERLHDNSTDEPLHVRFTCTPDFEATIAVDKKHYHSDNCKMYECTWRVHGKLIQENMECVNDLPKSDKFELFPYLPFEAMYHHQLAEFWQQIRFNEQSVADDIHNIMKDTMIPKLCAIEISTIHAEKPVIMFLQHGKEVALPLASFGEGTVKLFRILIEIVRNRGHRLMIDEIDAGIHIERFRDFWRIIVQFAARYNVQLFVTTHNIECLQTFNDVLEEPAMQQFQDKARCFTLIDSPVTRRVEAVCSTFEQFEHALAMRTELRGGSV
jgi:hypothetical protein